MDWEGRKKTRVSHIKTKTTGLRRKTNPHIKTKATGLRMEKFQFPHIKTKATGLRREKNLNFPTSRLRRLGWEEKILISTHQDQGDWTEKKKIPISPRKTKATGLRRKKKNLIATRFARRSACSLAVSSGCCVVHSSVFTWKQQQNNCCQRAASAVLKWCGIEPASICHTNNQYIPHCSSRTAYGSPISMEEVWKYVPWMVRPLLVRSVKNSSLIFWLYSCQPSCRRYRVCTDFSVG